MQRRLKNGQEGERMLDLNYTLLVEFNSLCKLLEDIYTDVYTDKAGVTRYINIMLSADPNRANRIPFWSEYLNRLKHCRDIRNKLAHPDSYHEVVECTQADIDWLRNFRSSILKGTDPVALLRKSVQARQNPPAANKQAQAYKPTPTYTTTRPYTYTPGYNTHPANAANETRHRQMKRRATWLIAFFVIAALLFTGIIMLYGIISRLGLLV